MPFPLFLAAGAVAATATVVKAVRDKEFRRKVGSWLEALAEAGADHEARKAEIANLLEMEEGTGVAYLERLASAAESDAQWSAFCAALRAVQFEQDESEDRRRKARILTAHAERIR